MSTVQWRTAAAPVVRHHYDTSEPAWWRARATPAARQPATPQCRLKVSSQATTRVPLRRHGVGSRLPLKMEPGADGHGSGEVDGRLLTRLAQASHGAAADRPRPPPRGAGALCRRRGAGERPPFSTPRARPNEHPSFCCDRAASRLQHIESGHRAGFRRQLATAGPLPFKAKEFVPILSECGTVLVLGRALQAPEVMLDDAVQAHPGRLRLRRPRRIPKVAVPLRPGSACLTNGSCRLLLDRIERVPPL